MTVELKHMRVTPVWFDSLGAKSACVLVETPDVRLLIDPGAAKLQPGFPIPDSEKTEYFRRACQAVEQAARRADVIVITHYHYDHHARPSQGKYDVVSVLRGKLILAKDPNQYINNSQIVRSRLFFKELAEKIVGVEFDKVLEEPRRTDFEDPLEWLEEALRVDLGDYERRRRARIEEGRKWFEQLSRRWASQRWVKELDTPELRVKFADGRSFTFGSTTVRFTQPMWHGVEYEKLGWVIGVVIECRGEKLIYTSDVEGPMIEDYATWIIQENPDILIVDTPPTHQLGFRLGKVNFQRAVRNIVRVLRESDVELVIYDHHALRDVRFHERLAEVFKAAEELRKRVMTAAELLGRKPLALEVSESSRA